MKNKYLIILFFMCVGLGFYLLNFYTPIMHDDIAYLFKYGPPSIERPTEVPVKSIRDIFESQYYHYLDVNGRAPLHFLIQLFLFLGKGLFNVVNSLVFISVIILIYKIVALKKGSSTLKVTLLTFIAASCWITSPFVGQTMLWLTGATNYLWGTLLVLIFLYLLNKQETNRSFHWFQKISFFLFSILAGWTQESITIGVSASLFFYYLFNRSQINTQRIIMILGFWLGTLLIIISPGTLNRVGAEIRINDISLLEQLAAKLINAFTIVKVIKINALIMVVLGVINYIKKKPLVAFFKTNSLYIAAIFFSLIFFTVIGKLDERLFFGVNILLILINVGLIGLLLQDISKNILKIISLFFVVILGYSFSQAIPITKDYNKQFIKIENSIKSSKDGIVPMAPFLNSRYVYNTLAGIKDNNNFHTRVMKLYLNVPTITILPTDVYTKFLPENTICTSKNIDKSWTVPLYWNKNFNYIIVDVTNNTLPTNFKPTIKIAYNKLDDENLKPHQYFIRKALGTLRKKEEIKSAFILKISNNSYILMDKDEVNINNIQKIEIRNELDMSNLIVEITKK